MRTTIRVKKVLPLPKYVYWHMIDEGSVRP